MESEHNTSFYTGKDQETAFSYWIYVLWPWILVIIAWSAIFIASYTDHLFLIDHDYLLQNSHLPWPLAFIVFLSTWQLMILAMMLPSVLPLLSFIVSANRSQRHLWLIQTIFILGYALTWTIFALVAFSCDALVHQLVNRWFWLYKHSYLIGVTILVIAGLFQLSPFKRRYLHCCRVASTIEQQQYQRKKQIWQMSWLYGWYCVGSCWALMLIMFALSARNILSMAALAMLMLIEKVVPGGQRIRPFVGILFLILAALRLVFSF